ncbi:hypothetical protein BH10PSE16_BH10PSE16_00850 [soil metagenome]
MTYMTEMMRDMARRRTAAPKLILDSAGTSGSASSDAFTQKDISLSSAAAVQLWAETDASELDSGETMADRLMSLMIGIADANKDGEITEDEQGVLDIALNAAWDYLAKMGVTDEDASALLNDWDVDTGDRVKELVAAALPEGEDESAADLDDFVFGDDDQEPMMDAAYKKVVAVRGGKKTRINKRISGTVRLSAKQKVAVRKMQMKSHSAVARMHRMKSVRVRVKAGL